MHERNFMSLLQARFDEGKLICAGIDPDIDRLPPSVVRDRLADTLIGFCCPIIEAVHPYVCAFKLNAAFFDEHGLEGQYALEQILRFKRACAPDVAEIFDGKRTDIAKTNKKYAKAAFEVSQVDAVTVNPYFGGLSLQPFFEWSRKGVFVLCRTSNEGAGEFQDMVFEGEPQYIHVARHFATTWNGNGNCGLVVGATYLDELRRIREVVGDRIPILAPGVGAQGGKVSPTVLAGVNSKGHGLLVNAGSDMLHASSGADYVSVSLSVTLAMDAEARSAIKGR